MGPTRLCVVGMWAVLFAVIMISMAVWHSQRDVRDDAYWVLRVVVSAWLAMTGLVAMSS
jgi:hypothetical protein